jgi:hypothetical protein
MTTSTKFSVDEAVAVLGRTPATMDALLRGLPDIWVRGNEGKDTWCAFDIVGHLIAGERTDWMVRMRTILDDGEARPFDPFESAAGRFGPPGKASDVGSGDAVGTAGDMGGSRPYSFASTVPRHGPSVS